MKKKIVLNEYSVEVVGEKTHIACKNCLTDESNKCFCFWVLFGIISGVRSVNL